MRLYSFITCTNFDGNVIGLQFILSANARLDPMAIKYPLDPIGQTNDECQEMKIAGPLTRIRASYSEENGVDSIRYYRGDQMKTYGELGDDYTEWQLQNDQPLVGVYGYQSERGIEKLGFITFDVQCQMELENEDWDWNWNLYQFE